jgi:hypothetical protein
MMLPEYVVGVIQGPAIHHLAIRMMAVSTIDCCRSIVVCLKNPAAFIARDTYAVSLVRSGGHYRGCDLIIIYQAHDASSHLFVLLESARGHKRTNLRLGSRWSDDGIFTRCSVSSAVACTIPTSSCSDIDSLHIVLSDQLRSMARSVIQAVLQRPRSSDTDLSWRRGLGVIHRVRSAGTTSTLQLLGIHILSH